MRKPRLFSAVLASLVLVLLAVWVGVAVSVDDALWFVPVFRANASYVELYWDGGHMLLEPDSSGYTSLNDALQQDLSRVDSYPTGAGLSDATLESLRVDGRLLEVHYTRPVRVHSRYHFTASRVFYIPLSGHHGELKRVFNLGRGVPLELRSTGAIVAAIEAIVLEAGLDVP
jgi:hypothetical protein